MMRMSHQTLWRKNILDVRFERTCVCLRNSKAAKGHSRAKKRKNVKREGGREGRGPVP